MQFDLYNDIQCWFFTIRHSSLFIELASTTHGLMGWVPTILDPTGTSGRMGCFPGRYTWTNITLWLWLTVCYRKWPSRNSFCCPIKSGDFPVCFLYVYQRVALMFTEVYVHYTRHMRIYWREHPKWELAYTAITRGYLRLIPFITCSKRSLHSWFLKCTSEYLRVKFHLVSA